MRVIQQAAPLRQEVVRLLRQDILDQQLRPGERLTENSLCSRYGVSRTVVREALRQLETENLITMRPHRGPIVAVLDEQEIRNIYEVRRCLEGLAGELFALQAADYVADELLAHMADMEQRMPAADLATREVMKERFYEILLNGADNSVLTSSLAGVHARIGIFRHYAFQDDRRVAISLRELRSITNAAARDRDPAAARLACEEHIRRAALLAVEEHLRRCRPRGMDPDPAVAN